MIQTTEICYFYFVPPPRCQMPNLHPTGFQLKLQLLDAMVSGYKFTKAQIEKGGGTCFLERQSIWIFFLLLFIEKHK